LSAEPTSFGVRVSAAAGERASVFARRHAFAVGAPVSFDEKYPEVSALECLLGALGADLVNGLRQVARARRVALDRVEAVLRGELEDPLAALGVIGATGSPGLRRVEAKVFADSPAPRETVEALFSAAVARSPLARTIERACALEITFHVTE
jgi:hypothetical protein